MTNYNRCFLYIIEDAQMSQVRMVGIRAVICSKVLLNILVDIGQSNKTSDCGTLRAVTIAFKMKAETYVCSDQMKQCTTASVLTERS
jgi:hypothetical protein